jgi:hypothetical protein
MPDGEQAASGRAAAGQEYRSRVLDIARAWLPVLTVVIGALWGLYEFIWNERKAETARLEQARTIEQQRVEQAQETERQRRAQAEKEAVTRRIEAQRPFLELQFKTYLRTTTLVGKLIVLDPTSADYQALRQEFDTLYWTELALVEDDNVSSAMVRLQADLSEYEKRPNDRTQIKVSALRLAHAIRDSIRSGWQGSAPAAAQDTK